MRDFVAYVRRHLPRREVSLEQYDEVVDELASELEARYTALVHRGSDEEDAWQEVLRQVPSWSALAHDLSSTSPGPTTPSRLSSLRNMLSVERWQRELAFGLRVLRKDRGFTLTSIFTIAVCILPREFSFGDPEVRFWIPLALTDRQRSDSARHRNGWFSIGRLKRGATIDQVREQLTVLDAANAERMPQRLRSMLSSTGFYTGVEPLQDVLVRDLRRPLYLLWGAALAVLVTRNRQSHDDCVGAFAGTRERARHSPRARCQPARYRPSVSC